MIMSGCHKRNAFFLPPRVCHIMMRDMTLCEKNSPAPKRRLNKYGVLYKIRCERDESGRTHSLSRFLPHRPVECIAVAPVRALLPAACN